jgi:hypothetical protein
LMVACGNHQPRSYAGSAAVGAQFYFKGRFFAEPVFPGYLTLVPRRKCDMRFNAGATENDTLTCAHFSVVSAFVTLRSGLFMLVSKRDNVMAPAKTIRWCRHFVRHRLAERKRASSARGSHGEGGG